MNKFSKRVVVILILGISVIFAACEKGTNDELNNTKVFGLHVPYYFPNPVYNNPLNKPDKLKFDLGKKLFFDPILSVDSTVSCASCHAPEHSFADHNIAVSIGVFNRLGKRNSPALINLAWSSHFNWDGGINHIEVFPVGPITNENEMGETMQHVLDKLNRHPQYSNLFKQAFGVSKIEDRELLYALTQYLIMLQSYNSKYDDVITGKAHFTDAEKRGYELFKAHCNACHQEPLFTNNTFRNNGTKLTANETGRYLITLDSSDWGKFKVPTLRNVALTYPYMHNGSLYSLNDVLEHYQNVNTEYANIDPLLKNGIKLSEQEKSDIISFLKTLNDYQFITNKTLQP